MTILQAEGHRPDEVDVDIDSTLPHLIPPSEEEAKLYYRGIISQPRLVGRASAGIVPYETIAEQKQAYLRDPDRSNWFTLKEKVATYIGRHRICAVWDSIEGSVRQQLSFIPWTSIDVVRLGCPEEPHASRPVTVWIGVEHGDIPWATVARVLRACKAILDRNGLEDVDVQIRVSCVFSLASLSTPPPDTLNEQLRPFANRVGNLISPFSCPSAVGSLAVSISPTATRDSEVRPVWAITCRHVAIPRSLDQGRFFHPDIEEEENEKPTCIFMPSDETTEITIDVLRAEHNALLSSEPSNSAQLAEASDAFIRATGFRDREARTAGSVLLSPPISVGTTPSTISSHVPWTKDYSVVELDLTKFAADELVNTIDAKELWASAIWCLHELRKALQLNHPNITVPKTGPIKIRGLITLDELESPHGLLENYRGDKCLVVMKKGASQGITFGCPGELRSTVRSCLPDGSTIITREWAIPGSLANQRMRFARRGDSGSVIVGFDGRLGGFLTRGAGTEKDTSVDVDITYFTPAVLALADIEKELGPVELL